MMIDQNLHCAPCLSAPEVRMQVLLQYRTAPSDLPGNLPQFYSGAKIR